MNSVKKVFSCVFLSLCASFILFSCASTPKPDSAQTEKTAAGTNADSPAAAQQSAHTPSAAQALTLLFAGDIMAHKSNYAYPAFSRIWEDIAPVVQSADLAFANIEAPVADSIPWNTYPQFNMHSNYVEAAISAGFDVFSLANNHTNDQSLDGMKETRAYFASRKGIWACGIKSKAGSPLTYQIIEKDGWKILFVAFTQVLNSWDSAGYIDYIAPKAEREEALIQELASLKAEHEPDLFVVSVHADEVEYKRTVFQKQKDLYHRLVKESGADVVWSNHAHVVKPWEIVPPSPEAPHGAIIMYANGNTISGQRTSPHWDAPDGERDWTGDGLMMTVIFTRTTGTAPASETTAHTITLTKTEPHFITTILAVDGQPVIRLLDDDLIHSMQRAARPAWSRYLAERKRLLEAFLFSEEK